MICRFLKFDLKNKKHYLIILVALLAFILYYLSIKDEIFFYGANYINNYIDYYITNYLNGDASQLLYNNGVLLYVESEIANIYSALYIYVICMGSTIFKIMSIVTNYNISYSIQIYTRLHLQKSYYTKNYENRI